MQSTKENFTTDGFVFSFMQSSFLISPRSAISVCSKINITSCCPWVKLHRVWWEKDCFLVCLWVYAEDLTLGKYHTGSPSLLSSNSEWLEWEIEVFRFGWFWTADEFPRSWPCLIQDSEVDRNSVESKKNTVEIKSGDNPSGSFVSSDGWYFWKDQVCFQTWLTEGSRWTAFGLFHLSKLRLEQSCPILLRKWCL
jgi:hypothetical protein